MRAVRDRLTAPEARDASGRNQRRDEECEGMKTDNGQGELRPRFMPQREATKKVKGDVPESVADDFEKYCKFVAEAAGVKPERVAGDVLAAALKDFMKA